MNKIRKVSIAFISLLALPMAAQADSLLTNGRPQLVAAESNLRELPSLRVFLADYLIPPYRGLSFRVQWTADGQPMPPNLSRVRARCIHQTDASDAVSCEALQNWFGDESPYHRRQKVKSQDRQAFSIPDMEYDTEYCFRFQADDEPWSAWTCARTAVKPALPIAPPRPTLTAIAESTETRVKNAAHPFAIYVEWDAVPDEGRFTESYNVSMFSDYDRQFVGNPDWNQEVHKLDGNLPYHQTIELPNRDPEDDYVIRVCAVNISGSRCSPEAKILGRAWAEKAKSHKELADAVFSTPAVVEKKDNSAALAAFQPDPAIASTVAESDQSIAAETALAQPAPTAAIAPPVPPGPAPSVALGRVQSTTPADPSLTICDYARSARARNSPAAPNLERQCTAAGGSFAPLPPPPPPH